MPAPHLASAAVVAEKLLLGRPAAPAEAGWNTLKTKLLAHGGAFASLEEARLEGAYCLDTCFNLDRRHSALGYRSPHQFEPDCLTSIS